MDGLWCQFVPACYTEGVHEVATPTTGRSMCYFEIAACFVASEIKNDWKRP